MNKLKIGNVTIAKVKDEVTYFIPEKMTGNKLKEFKTRYSNEINNFLKK